MSVVSGGSVTINPVADTTIYELCDVECPDGGSNGAGTFMFSGLALGSGERRLLMKFNPGAVIPEGAIITSARLILNDSTPDDDPTQTWTFNLHSMTAPWGEGASDAGDPGNGGAPPESMDASWLFAFFDTVQWSSPGANGDFDAEPSATDSYSGTGTNTWGSTDAMVANVQGWLDAPKTNYGWMLLGIQDIPSISRRFDTHETESGMQPRLFISYDDPPVVQQFTLETDTRFPQPNPTEYTNQVTAGDLDNDGDLDLVFANGPGFGGAGTPEMARIYINDGNGFFTDETVDRTGGHSGLFRGVELGDVENDGDLDIVLAQDFANVPNLLINDGNGFFNDEGDTRLPDIELSSSRGQFGDVDNDGDLDLFFTSGTTSRFTCGQYRLYLNDGNGFYVDATTTAVPQAAVCNNMDCIFGDIDNDFDIDIRTSSTGTANSRLYVNDGTGTFTFGDIPDDSSCYSYDFGDIDGDGDLDLLGANGGAGNAERLYVNDGAGSYAIADSQLQPNISIDDNDSKFLDYDNDGDLDLIVGALGGNSERIYTNDGTGNYQLTDGVIQLQTDSTLDIFVADLNADGTLDIVTAQGESGNFQNRIYINSGPADTIAPTIVDTEPFDDTMDTDGPYVIRTLVLDGMSSDRNFFHHGIRLHYTVDEGEEQIVDMRHSGGQVYRGEIPGQTPGAEVSYWVSATDFNDNVGIGATQSFAVSSDVIQIVTSQPPHDAIDARQPHAIDNTDPPMGWTALSLEFSANVEGLMPVDFSVSHEGADTPPPVIVEVTTVQHNADITLDRSISPGAWTTITHNDSGSAIRLGFLPADVNGDATSGPLDILALIDALNGVVALPYYATDVNRSAITEPQDILRTIDLLNGAGSYDAWNGQSLP
jgi:hypothetical protein